MSDSLNSRSSNGSPSSDTPSFRSGSDGSASTSQSGSPTESDSDSQSGSDSTPSSPSDANSQSGSNSNQPSQSDSYAPSNSESTDPSTSPGSDSSDNPSDSGDGSESHSGPINPSTSQPDSQSQPTSESQPDGSLSESDHPPSASDSVDPSTSDSEAPSASGSNRPSTSDSDTDPPDSISVSAEVINNVQRTLASNLGTIAHYKTPPDELVVTAEGEEQRAYVPGPGSELRKMLPWLTPPSNSIYENDLVNAMNMLGVEGSKTHLEELIIGLISEATKLGIDPAVISRVIAKSLVSTAIRRFERKYPDGAQGDAGDVDL